MKSILQRLGAIHLLLFSWLSVQIIYISALEEILDLNLPLDNVPIEIEDSPPSSPGHPIEIEDSPPTSPLNNQQESPTALRYIGEGSQINSKRKNKKQQANIEGLEDKDYMEGVEYKTQQVPTSSKKARMASKNKDIKRSSSSKIDSSTINSIDKVKEIAITHDLIPSTLLTDIESWFKQLEATLVNKAKPYVQRTFKKAKKILPHTIKIKAVSNANAVAISFLACMKLLHEDQYHEMNDWETQIFEDAWIFIKSVFHPWDQIGQDDIKISKRPQEMTKALEYVDNLQPLFLYNHLQSAKSADLSLKFLWTFWKRWYRESIYQNKRFLATETGFVRRVQYSILHNGLVQSSIHPEVNLQSFKPMDEFGSHHQMLKEHSLQYVRPKGYSPNSEIDPEHLEHILYYVGKLELELLEQHQRVDEFLEWLNQDLAHKLTSQKDNKNKNGDKLKAISKCVSITYQRLVPIFFGAVKLMEKSTSLVPIKDEDKTVSEAWKFLERHLNNWKKIILGNRFHLELPEDLRQDPTLIQSHSLLLTMLNLNSDSHIPFEIISKLYYLKNNFNSDVIGGHGIGYHDDMLKHQLIESFLDLQKKVE